MRLRDPGYLIADHHGGAAFWIGHPVSVVVGGPGFRGGGGFRSTAAEAASSLSNMYEQSSRGGRKGRDVEGQEEEEEEDFDDVFQYHKTGVGAVFTEIENAIRW